MNDVIDFISQPWPWYVAGPIIAATMAMLLFLGDNFGVSANLRTICSIVGAGKNCEFFAFDWKAQTWNLVFAIGMMIGGFISHEYLSPSAEVNISEETRLELLSMGIEQPGSSLAPLSVFSWESLLTIRGFIIVVIGGFFVGFGTRYAGGCTSGHAISGLSDLQPASAVAVVGFFLGGLIMTYFILPYLLVL